MHPQSSTPPEQWCPVVGWEGLYSVSDQGRVRSERQARNSYPGRLLKLWLTDTPPRWFVTLYRQGRPTNYMVHRLVAAAFIGPCPHGHEVNHLNGVRTDNRPGNLEYVTPRQNIEHAVEHGLMARGDASGARLHPERLPRGERNGLARLTDAQVQEARALRQGGMGVRALARRFGVGSGTMSKMLRGLTWRHVL